MDGDCHSVYVSPADTCPLPCARERLKIGLEIVLRSVDTTMCPAECSVFAYGAGLPIEHTSSRAGSVMGSGADTDTAVIAVAIDLACSKSDDGAVAVLNGVLVRCGCCCCW